MDYNKIKELAQGYEKDMTAFLRAIVKNPGESCGEKAHVETIAAEMKKLNFDEVVIDPQGNVMGYMGTGSKIIAYDAHIDTVGIGNKDNWNFDPYDGFESDTEIGGRLDFRYHEITLKLVLTKVDHNEIYCMSCWKYFDAFPVVGHSVENTSERHMLDYI